MLSIRAGIENMLSVFTDDVKPIWNVPEEIIVALDQMLNIKSDILPSRDVISGFFTPDYKSIQLGSILAADQYKNNAFVMYTHELLTAIKVFTDHMGFTKVHELCCGTGIFSHWMVKYGIPVGSSVDNKTWEMFKHHDLYLPNVTDMDAVKFVQENQDAESFILSWPYMDSTAADIWKSMRKGQYLLYIGEIGGCTADDEFFNLVRDSEIEDNIYVKEMQRSFVQFTGVHDLPFLYRKG